MRRFRFRGTHNCAGSTVVAKGHTLEEATAHLLQNCPYFTHTGVVEELVDDDPPKGGPEPGLPPGSE